MARLICNECQHVVMFAGNVKTGNPCPKCGSGNTGKAALIKFTGTNFAGSDDSLRKWDEQVRHNNNNPGSTPSINLRGNMDEPWYRYEKSRMEALGLR